MGFILYLVAVIMRPLLYSIGFIFSIAMSFYRNHFRTGIKNTDQKFLILAKSIDKYGNVICADWFNWVLITKEAKVKFGRIEQTISAVLGHNEAAGTLTGKGKWLCRQLNRLDEEHTVKAAKEDKYITENTSFS